jgi:hypothetical protein
VGTTRADVDGSVWVFGEDKGALEEESLVMREDGGEGGVGAKEPESFLERLTDGGGSFAGAIDFRGLRITGEDLLDSRLPRGE